MTETKGVAASWLEGLAARGLTVTVRRGKLVLHHAKPNPYKQLTDAEAITLRHHRADIIAAVNAGISLDVVRAAPVVESATPAAAAPEPCSYCYRSPCIGVEHSAYFALHPVERRQRDDERLNAEFQHWLKGPRRMEMW